MESIIIKCGIGIIKDESDPSVVVVFEGGKPEVLFKYRPSEITFTKEDFIGLTKIEAFMFRSRKENIFLTK